MLQQKMAGTALTGRGDNWGEAGVGGGMTENTIQEQARPNLEHPNDLQNIPKHVVVGYNVSLLVPHEPCGHIHMWRISNSRPLEQITRALES